MSDSKILVILTVLACVALSFLFSGMETGVLALNRFRVRQLMRTGDRRAAVLHGFMENPENFLWTILVGNTVVNFVIFSLGSIQLLQIGWENGRCCGRWHSQWQSFFFTLFAS